MTDKELKEAAWLIIAGIVFIGVYLGAGPTISRNPYGWIVWGIGAVFLLVGIIALLRTLFKK